MQINNLAINRLLSPPNPVSRSIDQVLPDNTQRSFFVRDSVVLDSVVSPYATYGPTTVNATKTSAASVMSREEALVILEGFKDIVANTDYSQMNDVEIYNSIYDRYNEAFGDFLSQHRLHIPYDLKTHYYYAANAFRQELCSHFGWDGAMEVTRKANYGDMSDVEIRNALAEKYHSGPLMTLRNALSMTYELSFMGMDDNTWAFLSSCSSGSDEEMYRLGFDGPYPEYWQMLLDRPVNLERLCSQYDRWTYYGSDRVDAGVGKLLCYMFQLNLDSKGYFDYDKLFFKGSQ